MLINFSKILNGLCVFLYLTSDTSASILELFSRKLQNNARKLNLEGPVFTKDDSPALSMIKQYGYPAEGHEIVTEDGYILTVHRIPYGRKSFFKPGKVRPAVMVQHGILASSDTWLLRGPENDIVFLLADSGYDVWITNARGNFYSRRHVTLDPNRDKEFWDFSFHEMGYYDLPAVIDYITSATSQKSLYYIGHSMGTTMFFVMSSTRPEYNQKIKLMQALAPAAYLIHPPSPLLSLVISQAPSLAKSFRDENIFELFPLRQITGTLGRALCTVSAPTQPLCVASVFVVAGIDYDQLDTALLPKMFEVFPAGTSLDTFMHFYQNIVNASFKMLDRGEEENWKRYHNPVALDYDLSAATAPIAVYYGNGDYIVRKQDAERTASKLPNLVSLTEVPFPNFNHLDFIWGNDVRKLLYEDMLVLMGKFR